LIRLGNARFAAAFMMGEETGARQMRCYFHLENDTSRLPDEDGIEVADLLEARTQAFMAVQEVLGEHSDTDGWRGWRLRVVDVTGDLMFFLPLGRPEVACAFTPRQSFAVPLRLASLNVSQ